MDAIKSIGGFFGSPAGKAISTLGQVGSGVAGTVGNIKANELRNQPVEQQLALQKRYMDMTPADFTKGIDQFTRPMSQGLTSGVGNLVQANLAERGLSSSPGVFADIMAQSLAPFQMQEQQRAMQAYFQSLGLPVEAAARFLPTPEGQSTASIWQQIFSRLNGGMPTAASTRPPTAPNTPAQLSNMESSIPGWSAWLNSINGGAPGVGVITPESTISDTQNPWDMSGVQAATA